jgi:Tol biopolymer transport system component
MPDVQEVFRLATSKVEPDPDALERQVRRQRAAARKSRVRAYVAVAAVLVILGIALFAISRTVTKNGTVSDNHGSTPNWTFSTTLPPGATPQKPGVINQAGNQTATIPGMPVDAFAVSVTPDGNLLAFVASPNEDVINQIGVMNSDGTGARFVPTPGIDVGAIAISPDGTRVAFEGTVQGNTDIYIVNSDGNGLLRLTNDPNTDQFPTWSPDGATIAYDNAGAKEQTDPQFSKTGELFTVSAEGGAVTRITHNDGYDAAPDFSPDGKRIADQSFQGLSMMSADGSGYHAIERSIGGFTPRFSPDGKTVAFSYFSDRWRPDVQLGANYSPSSALCLLATADVATGRVTTLPNVAMATDYNTPRWVDNQHILVMRVPARNPQTH